MREVMSREVAVEEILGWARALGEVYTAEEVETSKTLAAVMTGRVSFDEETESFEYKLIKPLALENGKTIESIKIEEPTAEYLLRRSTLKIEKNGSSEMELDTEARFLASSTGQPIGILQRVKSRDIGVIKELAHFFG